MLPAIELDGRIITEIDDILVALEQVFGSSGAGMEDPTVLPLQRLFFRAWCPGFAIGRVHLRKSSTTAISS